MERLPRKLQNWAQPLTSQIADNKDTVAPKTCDNISGHKSKILPLDAVLGIGEYFLPWLLELEGTWSQ